MSEELVKKSFTSVLFVLILQDTDVAFHLSWWNTIVNSVWPRIYERKICWVIFPREAFPGGFSKKLFHGICCREQTAQKEAKIEISG